MADPEANTHSATTASANRGLINLLTDPSAVFRFTTEENLPQDLALRWAPDDVDDFIEQLRPALLDDDAIACLAQADSGGCPDIEIHAGLALLRDVPWPAPRSPEHYVVFIDNSETGFTIVEFPTRQTAAAAFTNHINNHTDHGHYDYLVDPKRPQTARPLDWPSITWPDTTSTIAHPSDTELLDQTTTDTDLEYGLTRVHRINSARVRITIRRHVLEDRSTATVEERASDGSWHHLIDTPINDWIRFMPHPAAPDFGPKYTAANDVANDLLNRSRRILSW